MSLSATVASERNAAEYAALTPAQRRVYDEAMRRDGSPRFAMMCAMQSPPGTRNTDRAFCEGQRRKMEKMDAGNRKKIVGLAQRAGIQTDGKFYMSGLGKYTDPKAWVSCAEDVVTSCKMQNASVEGVINFTPKTLRPGKPKPEPALAEDAIQEMAGKYLKADPALREKVKKNKHAARELREMVIERHGRPKRPPKRKKSI